MLKIAVNSENYKIVELSQMFTAIELTLISMKLAEPTTSVSDIEQTGDFDKFVA